jgi:hypothetical protein
MPNVKNVNRFLFIKHNKQETVSTNGRPVFFICFIGPEEFRLNVVSE